MNKLNTPTVPVKAFKDLKVVDDRRSYRYRPVTDRAPRLQRIRERAEFLAHEVFADRLAPEAEIADAIEIEIRRFAKRTAR